jgi:hypothetical protein
MSTRPSERRDIVVISSALRAKAGGLQLRKVTVSQRKRIGAEWIILSEAGIAQAGSLSDLGRSLGVLKNWEPQI